MSYIVIDVREPYEYQGGHVKGSLNIPPEQLAQGAPDLSSVAKDAEIIVYCRTGNRSTVAKNILNKLGYTNVVNGINKEQIEASIRTS